MGTNDVSISCPPFTTGGALDESAIATMFGDGDGAESAESRYLMLMFCAVGATEEYRRTAAEQMRRIARDAPGGMSWLLIPNHETTHLKLIDMREGKVLL